MVLVCLSGVRVVRMKSRGRFGFCGLTVLLAYRGRQVSFNTTVHGNGVVLLKDKFKRSKFFAISQALGSCCKCRAPRFALASYDQSASAYELWEKVYLFIES